MIPRPAQVIVQLARLGDLMQSMPAIATLAAQTEAPIDLVCPAPFLDLAMMIPGIRRVCPVDGQQWHHALEQWSEDPRAGWDAIEHWWKQLRPEVPYQPVFVLNQHPRAILLGHLLGRTVRGASIPAERHQESPWARYVREVLVRTEDNPVHLADIWIGFCGQRPQGLLPTLQLPAPSHPEDCPSWLQHKRPHIALIVGAGDPARQVPPAVWAQLITRILENQPGVRIILIGAAAEYALEAQIMNHLGPNLREWVIEACGLTPLRDLAIILQHCQWVIGSDTGPLHVAASVGTRVIGWYHGLARVQDTGPYGQTHWVWQADRTHGRQHEVHPTTWPIEETAALIQDPQDPGMPWTCPGWTRWESTVDQWGVRYHHAPRERSDTRRMIWEQYQSGQAPRRATVTV